MEVQLQIYLIIGITSFFIAALILTSSLLAYYVVKLYKIKNSEEKNEESYLRKNGVGYTNNAVDLDDELNRRYTMHTPEPEYSSTDVSKIDDKSLKRSKTNKDTTKSNIIASKNSKGSVIDVSEEFNWHSEANSKYNTNITLQHREEFVSVHESRTAFNDRTV